MSAILATAGIWAPYAIAAIGAAYAALSKRWIFLRRVDPILGVLAKAAVAQVERDFVAPEKAKRGGRKLTLAEQAEARDRATKAVRASLAKLGAGADDATLGNAVEDAVWSLKPKVVAK